MKRSRFSEEEIIGVLKEAEATTVKATCAKRKYQRGDVLTDGGKSTAGWMSMRRGDYER